MNRLLALILPARAFEWGVLTQPPTSDVARAAQAVVRFCDAFIDAFGPSKANLPPTTVRIRVMDALIRCTYWGVTVCERMQIVLVDRRNALALRQWDDA